MPAAMKAHGALTERGPSKGSFTAGHPTVLDLLFLVIGIPVLLGMLAHAAFRENINNRCATETIRHPRGMAAAQQARQPRA
jgi:hypothetical protein